MIDCRNALVRSAGDYDAAKHALQELGASKAVKKSERETSEGLVASYIHAGGKIGALVEVNCETDFVARNERFRELVRDIAMHVTAMSPEYVSREVVPAELLATQRAEIATTVPAGKPPEVVEKIVEGRLNKWFEERVLLDQPFVRNDEQTVGELIAAVIGVLGENIQVRRFTKFALGER
ncbi:MAG: translation elongation factor Ts [Candidatus Baltobacteraceae bacterium]